MGQAGLCGVSELEPQNYPAPKRYMRHSFNAEIDVDEDPDLRGSSPRRSSPQNSPRTSSPRDTLNNSPRNSRPSHLCKSGSRSKLSRKGHQIHVMSYNLLADQMCSPDYFTYASPQVLDFNFRGPRVIEEISLSEASLICLQEVDRIDDFYEPKLNELGFSLIYGRREVPEYHTLVVGYRSEEWVLIDTEQIEFSDLSEVFPDLDEFKKRKQAILCLFRHVKTNETIVVGNTHFEHNPIFDHVKFAQACFYMEKIAKYIRDNKTMS